MTANGMIFLTCANTTTLPPNNQKGQVWDERLKAAVRLAWLACSIAA
jgi:hypothetical protein